MEHTLVETHLQSLPVSASVEVDHRSLNERVKSLEATQYFDQHLKLICININIAGLNRAMKKNDKQDAGRIFFTTMQ